MVRLNIGSLASQSGIDLTGKYLFVNIRLLGIIVKVSIQLSNAITILVINKWGTKRAVLLEAKDWRTAREIELCAIEDRQIHLTIEGIPVLDMTDIVGVLVDYRDPEIYNQALEITTAD